MKKEDLSFVGDIISAQIGATHDVMNQLSDLGWEAALEWAEAYRELWISVKKENDSIRVERVLHSHALPAGDDTLDHYRYMGHQPTIASR